MSGPGKNRNRRSGAPGAGSTGRGRGSGGSSRPPRSGGRGGTAGRAGGRNTAPAPANRKRSQGLGGDQVEGRQAVRELLLAGRRRAKQVLIADETENAEVLTDIAELARDLEVPVRTVTRKRLAAEAATTAHQGVIAQAAPLPEADADELMANPKAFLLVLDGITDPGNLGALLRTAECAGVTGVILPRHRAVHISPTVTKTAAGAVEHLDLAVVGGIPAALQSLSNAGVATIGLDAGGDASLFEAMTMADGPVALVLGAEGRGLSRLVRQRVDQLVAIPLAGGLNSLNVAAAAAIACFEVVRRRNPVPQ